MIHYIPKVIIYRIGKYTPYKGLSQEIEMMIKFCNNEEGKEGKISFSSYFDMQDEDLEPVNIDVDNEDATTKESNTEIVKIDKIQKA